MSFIWPILLLSLILVPLLIGLYIRLLRKQRQAAIALGPLGLVQGPSGRPARFRRHLPFAFFLAGLALLLFGLARPEMVVNLPSIEGTVILAFDVSNSMTADDLEPTRLEAAKTAARAFVEDQPSTIAIGIVAFGNGGLIVQAPTHDQAAVLEAIGRLSPQGGTSLGEGIFASLNAIAGKSIASDAATVGEGVGELRIEDYSSAVILLLSDGENTRDPDPLELAQLAAEAGVRIYPVGIGSPEGGIVQVDGFSIITQLQEQLLREIASVTNGEYYFAADQDSLNEIYENVDLQLTIEGENTEATSVFASAGLLFLLLGGLSSLVWFGRIP
ncbi:MAG TPA: VWA domain-containing protein [Anaerolineales bacterium]|nr:VWA domain-containing protein [Anaerolineales bacterium]